MSNKKHIYPVSLNTNVDTELVVTEQQPNHAMSLYRAITTDEHAGKGGSYTYDPATGQRTRNQDSA
jgi:hypothetical protein